MAELLPVSNLQMVRTNRKMYCCCVSWFLKKQHLKTSREAQLLESPHFVNLNSRIPSTFSLWTPEVTPTSSSSELKGIGHLKMSPGCSLFACPQRKLLHQSLLLREGKYLTPGDWGGGLAGEREYWDYEGHPPCPDRVCLADGGLIRGLLR